MSSSFFSTILALEFAVFFEILYKTFTTLVSRGYLKLSWIFFRAIMPNTW